MADTYRKICLHVVFAVKRREALLEKSWRHQVFKYIAGIITNRGHFCYAVNGYNDHIHILFDYKGHELIHELVREVKKASTKYINLNNLATNKFQWQSGYGVFSVGYREIDRIIKYVLNQEEHHRKRTFREEYLSFLKAYEVEFNQKYNFHFLD